MDYICICSSLRAPPLSNSQTQGDCGVVIWGLTIKLHRRLLGAPVVHSSWTQLGIIQPHSTLHFFCCAFCQCCPEYQCITFHCGGGGWVAGHCVHAMDVATCVYVHSFICVCATHGNHMQVNWIISKTHHRLMTVIIL